MADTKVSDLTPITVASDSDVLYIVRASAGGTSNKITFQNLLSGVNDSITTLTTTVDTNQSTVLDLSGTFESANINIGPLTTTTRILCSVQLGLSAELDELSDDVEGIATVLNTASAVTDAFTMTRVATSDLSATHTFNVNLNGAAYKILLHQV